MITYISNTIHSIITVLIFFTLLPIIFLFAIVGTLLVLVHCILTGQRIDKYEYGWGKKHD